MYGDITDYRGTEQKEIGTVVLSSEEDHKEHLRIAHCDDGRAAPSLDVRMFVDSERGRRPYKGPTKEGFHLYGKQIITFFAQMRLAEEEFEIEPGAMEEAIEKIRSDRSQ